MKTFRTKREPPSALDKLAGENLELALRNEKLESEQARLASALKEASTALHSVAVYFARMTDSKTCLNNHLAMKPINEALAKIADVLKGAGQ